MVQVLVKHVVPLGAAELTKGEGLLLIELFRAQALHLQNVRDQALFFNIEVPDVLDEKCRGCRRSARVGLFRYDGAFYKSP
jgi:hypothetical protein